MTIRHFLALALLFLSPCITLGQSAVEKGAISREEIQKEILKDFAQRVDPSFHIPKSMSERVAFWFDVYTLYGSHHHVIHHVRYPWIVFEVQDVTDRVETGKGPRWLRQDRANKFVKQRAVLIKKSLQALARGKRRNLSSLEKSLLEAVKKAPGKSLNYKLKLASNNVRTQLGQRDFFRNGLEQSTHYLSHMEKEFEKMGLPTELTRMPFVESSFNTEARSRVGASGIWQIMPLTGKAYMIVSDHIDERNNPIKATTAAGKLLKSYHRALKDWPLTITSYNHGIGNIRKAIKKAGSSDLPTIIQRYHAGHFKFASSNFFACFLAALHAEKYSELLFADVQRRPEKDYEVTVLSRAIRPKDLLKTTGLSKEEFIKFNLDLKSATQSNRRLPKGLKIFLPTGVNKTLAAN